MKTIVRQSRIHGRGVFAAKMLLRGEAILAIDDSRIVDDGHPLAAEADEEPYYCDYLPDGTVILMREPERYINHSCEPNCHIYSMGKERCILALRDIAFGGEIVYDYAMNASTADAMDCRCGSKSCRGIHVPAFFELPIIKQMERLPYLDPWFAAVESNRIALLIRKSLSSQ